MFNAYNDDYGEDLRAAPKRAEIRHRPVHPAQLHKAFDKARRLPERHAEQDFHCKAGLDGGVRDAQGWLLL